MQLRGRRRDDARCSERSIRKSCEGQERSVTTSFEALLNKVLGELFRRDAMNALIVVASVSRGKSRPQN